MSRLLRQVLAVFFLTFSVFWLTAAAVADQPRTALVIGNADYDFSPLANSVNDARAIARALEKAGFNVILQTDASRDGMADAIRTFGESLKASGGVGLFYYAGHGVQIQGENYLLPIGGEVSDEETLKRQSLAVSEAVDAMTAAHDGLNIIVLDACRNNPISGAANGLSRIDSNASLFVSYSTSPGAVALDGEGSNSPYTKHLASAIETPSLSLEETFKRTLKGVYQETAGQQTPWMSSTFFGDFTFVERGGWFAEMRNDEIAVTASMGQALAQSVDRAGPARQISGVYQADGRNPDGSTYSGVLTITPENGKVRFNWWIGKDVFTGIGEFAGRMLVVNWGDKNPVVYTFGVDGTLEGEWADGTATETLTPYAKAAPRELELSEGDYGVEGFNPNGTTYKGTVNISRQGRKYTLAWKVGSDSYRGVGELAGNVLTVDWGDTTPVVYALTEDGSLIGLWAGGRGAEHLHPKSNR